MTNQNTSPKILTKVKSDQNLNIQKFIQRTSFAFLSLILNGKLLSNLPIKEKVPSDHCTNLDPSLILFLYIILLESCSAIRCSRSSKRNQRSPLNEFLNTKNLIMRIFWFASQNHSLNSIKSKTFPLTGVKEIRRNIYPWKMEHQWNRAKELNTGKIKHQWNGAPVIRRTNEMKHWWIWAQGKGAPVKWSTSKKEHQWSHASVK